MVVTASLAIQGIDVTPAVQDFTYISNSKENGTIGNTAEGVKCEGKENVIRFTNLFSYIIISHYHIT